MRKAWFCYEMGAKGPTVAIYYDDLPNEKNKLNRTVLQKYELGDEYWFVDEELNIYDEVQASFEQLKQAFPYTGNHYDVEAAEPIAVAAE